MVQFNNAILSRVFTARRVCIALTMLWQDVCLSVRSSVRLSVTRRCSVETAKHILKLFSPLDIQTILVFPYQTP